MSPNPNEVVGVPVVDVSRVVAVEGLEELGDLVGEI